MTDKKNNPITDTTSKYNNTLAGVGTGPQLRRTMKPRSECCGGGNKEHTCSCGSGEGGMSCGETIRNLKEQVSEGHKGREFLIRYTNRLKESVSTSVHDLLKDKYPPLKISQIVDRIFLMAQVNLLHDVVMSSNSSFTPLEVLKKDTGLNRILWGAIADAIDDKGGYIGRTVSTVPIDGFTKEQLLHSDESSEEEVDETDARLLRDTSLLEDDSEIDDTEVSDEGFEEDEEE